MAARPTNALSDAIARVLTSEKVRAKYTLIDLERLTPYGRTLIGDTLNGDRPITIPELTALAAVFGMTEEEVIAEARRDIEREARVKAARQALNRRGETAQK